MGREGHKRNERGLPKLSSRSLGFEVDLRPARESSGLRRFELASAFSICGRLALVASGLTGKPHELTTAKMTAAEMTFEVMTTGIVTGAEVTTKISTGEMTTAERIITNMNATE